MPEWYYSWFVTNSLFAPTNGARRSSLLLVVNVSCKARKVYNTNSSIMNAAFVMHQTGYFGLVFKSQIGVIFYILRILFILKVKVTRQFRSLNGEMRCYHVAERVIYSLRKKIILSSTIMFSLIAQILGYLNAFCTRKETK